ncbi:MAG: PAC2 family protein [Candidatus Omnitrophota bacterium]
MQNTVMLKKPRLMNPILIVAWPGMGEVALKCASYLVEHLKAEAFAYMDSANYFYPMASKIKNGIINTKELPQSYFYYWKNPECGLFLKTAAASRSGASMKGQIRHPDIKLGLKEVPNDLIIFLSNAQPDLSKAYDYVNNILEVARLYKVKTIISFAAMPAPIDHTHMPGVWFSATDKELFKYLEKSALKPMGEGEISGMNGLFLGLAKKNGFSGFCLLGEIPIYTIQIENPRAVFAILERLKNILGLPLVLGDLEKQARFIEGEINKLVDYLKEGIALPGGGPGPISDAEIEKIKKSLSRLTHLPQSVKQNIEKLFDLAKKDISKANELKQELDKWTVYKEYEDRFLDLFKKPKDKDN